MVVLDQARIDTSMDVWVTVQEHLSRNTPIRASLGGLL